MACGGCAKRRAERAAQREARIQAKEALKQAAAEKQLAQNQQNQA